MSRHIIGMALYLLGVICAAVLIVIGAADLAAGDIGDGLYSLAWGVFFAIASGRWAAQQFRAARAHRASSQLTAEEITPQIATHVLWHYGEGGFQPGSFTRALIDLIAKADPHNRRRLAEAFPGYVAACNWAEATDGGIADLRTIAAGER